MKTHTDFLLLLYRATQEKKPAEFDEYALKLLKIFLKFDSAVTIGAQISKQNASFNFAIQDLHIHNQPIEKLYDRNYFDGIDPVLDKALRETGRSVAISAKAAAQGRPDLIAYTNKYNIAHTLVLVPEIKADLSGNLVSLWRADEDHVYTQQEIAFADLFLPHLLQAQQLNRQYFLLNNPNFKPHRIGLISTLAGVLHFSDEYAVNMLQQEWPSWHPPVLPCKLIDELSRSNRKIFHGKHIKASAEKIGELLYIVIYTTDVTQLTKRETEVAALASKGYSRKAIAKELNISTETVKNQLSSIYQKLSISNKTALASLYFDK